MALDPSMKRPLTSGQFAWVISKKSGVLSMIIGPDPMDATDDELFVIPSKSIPTKVEQVDSSLAAIQDFVLIKPGEYAIIHNPSESFTQEYPNGAYTKGRGDAKPLRHGTKRVVTSGYFPVWPGQRVEVRQIHTLSSNQFLMAVVESENIDVNAPYYEITMKCASIKKAVINSDSIKDTLSEKTSEKSTETSLLTEDTPAKVSENSKNPDETVAKGVENKKHSLKLGQRIIIPGNLTPTYIPPSGIEIVPDQNRGIASQSVGRLSEYEGYTGTTNMVRQAVVLGPTEFCVLMDEDGQPQVKKGPGRVFPGPYDIFRTKDSRNCAYDAYHLRPDRGLLLRIVDDQIKKEELSQQLPAGSQLDKNVYTKGDEIFIYGFDAYIIPCPSIEIIDPVTRTPHIGNNHTSIYVQAIGVDQKSGVYVASVETGSVNLHRGEKKIILDPRKERHVKRMVPKDMWNLIIGKGEPHKEVFDERMIETPWALSVIIPNNEAVLVTSKDGRRPVVGPKTILLGYEEWLEVLQLSRGRPKTDNSPLYTCFLRVSGNRISDQIVLETSDFVKIVVDVQYSIEFVGEKEEDQIRWFSFKDYVKFFTSNLRSRLRAAAKKVDLSKLYITMADFVRDTVLGDKPENGHRPGLTFKENNLKVIEVDVLSTVIPDSYISESFNDNNRAIVLSELRRLSEEVGLESEKRRNVIAKEREVLEKEAIKRQKEIDILRLEATRETEAQEIKNRKDLTIDQEAINTIKSDAILARSKVTSEQEILIYKVRTNVELYFKKIQADLEKALLEASSNAEVKKLQAIQPGLIKAIEGLGDKQVLAELSKSLPKATGELGYLLGSGGISGLLKMLDGTKFGETLKNVKVYTEVKSSSET